MGDAPLHRAGVAALLGPPNVGKSTLLNRLLGEKLAIVTAKPQTTRSRILGISNVPGAQILFLDTPGLHESEKPLNVALNDAVEEAARDCDVALLLVDLTRGWSEIHDRLYVGLRARATPVFLVGTKSDLADEAQKAEQAGEANEPAWPPEQARDVVAAHRISARANRGIDALVAQIAQHLPESPPLYPGEEVTDRPVRWLAAELVREALFEELGQELPYSMAVDVVEFDESRADLVRIRANLLVERDSQKRIVVGRNGEMVKRIGSKARRQIQRLLGCKVHLELFVKLDPRWLKSPKRIQSLGYH